MTPPIRRPACIMLVCVMESDRMEFFDSPGHTIKSNSRTTDSMSQRKISAVFPLLMALHVSNTENEANTQPLEMDVAIARVSKMCSLRSLCDSMHHQALYNFTGVPTNGVRTYNHALIPLCF